jgi:hypothetical protein
MDHQTSEILYKTTPEMEQCLIHPVASMEQRRKWRWKEAKNGRKETQSGTIRGASRWFDERGRVKPSIFENNLCSSPWSIGQKCRTESGSPPASASWKMWTYQVRSFTR